MNMDQIYRLTINLKRDWIRIVAILTMMNAIRIGAIKIAKIITRTLFMAMITDKLSNHLRRTCLRNILTIVNHMCQTILR